MSFHVKIDLTTMPFANSFSSKARKSDFCTFGFGMQAASNCARKYSFLSSFVVQIGGPYGISRNWRKWGGKATALRICAARDSMRSSSGKKKKIRATTLRLKIKLFFYFKMEHLSKGGNISKMYKVVS